MNRVISVHTLCLVDCLTQSIEQCRLGRTNLKTMGLKRSKPGKEGRLAPYLGPLLRAPTIWARQSRCLEVEDLAQHQDQ